MNPRVLELLEAATSMCNEVTGVLGAFEDSLRQEMGNTNVAVLRHRLDKLSSAIASLDSSEAQQDWIEIKEGCEMPEYGETVRMICGTSFGEPYQEVCAWEFTMGWEEARACGITHYIKLDWPTPPSTAPKDGN